MKSKAGGALLRAVESNASCEKPALFRLYSATAWWPWLPREPNKRSKTDGILAPGK